MRSSDASDPVDGLREGQTGREHRKRRGRRERRRQRARRLCAQYPVTLTAVDDEERLRRVVNDGLVHRQRAWGEARA